MTEEDPDNNLTTDFDSNKYSVRKIYFLARVESTDPDGRWLLIVSYSRGERDEGQGGGQL
jgi:hypothetical protein